MRYRKVFKYSFNAALSGADETIKLRLDKLLTRPTEHAETRMGKFGD
jgi:hypothetical protein